jgi:hypothetical protein
LIEGSAKLQKELRNGWGWKVVVFFEPEEGWPVEAEQALGGIFAGGCSAGGDVAGLTDRGNALDGLNFDALAFHGGEPAVIVRVAVSSELSTMEE